MAEGSLMRWQNILSVVLTFALLASGALAQGSREPSAEAVGHYAEGLRHLDRGALEAAEAELEEAVRIDPEYLEAIGSLALVYLRRGKRAHYRAFLERASELKARESSRAGPRMPRLAPPQLPGGSVPPKKVERARAALPDQRRWRHVGPEPKGVYVVEREAMRGPLGNLRIEGTVKNNSSETVRRVVVALVGFNAEGRPVGPPLTYRGPWELPPGEEAPFSLDLSDSNDHVERFDLKASWGGLEE